MAPWFCFYSLSSLYFSTSHIRSFCLSFLILAIVFTFLNFLTTTTSVNKLSTADYTIEQNSSTTTSSLPLLLLSFEDVNANRFNCYEQTNHLRLHGKKNNKISFPTIELNQPNKTSFERRKIPYDYDTWTSSPSMPRLVTKCEHNLMMQLLNRFDQLTKKYSLEYMMTDGTLLGKFILSFLFLNNSNRFMASS
jgi:hypothetical protein